MKQCLECYHWDSDAPSSETGACLFMDSIEAPDWLDKWAYEAPRDRRITRFNDGQHCPCFLDVDDGVNADLFDKEMAKDD